MKRSLVALVRTHHRRALGTGLVVVAATAAAALLVARGSAWSEVTRQKPLEHPDTPTPTPALGSQTTSGHVRATIALSNEAVPIGRLSHFSAIVRVAADPLPAGDRAPVSFVLVIDRSGSMGGGKLEDAKRAARALVHSLRSGDEIAVIAYDGQASRFVERGPIERSSGRALQAISDLQVGGSTNIGAALELAQQELAGVDDSRVRRIVLVSDGNDTSGQTEASIVDWAAYGRNRGVSVSTVGIGTDYDEHLMTRIADASQGNYHYLQAGASLSPILTRELGEMVTTVAKNLVAEITLPTGLRLVQATGADATPGDRKVTLSFGYLFGGDERRAVLELAVAPREAGPIGALAGTLTWSDRATRAAQRAALRPVRLVATADDDAIRRLTNPAEVEEWLEVASTARHEQARAAWEAGDIDRLRAIENDNIRRLEQENARLRSAEIAAQVREYQHSLGQMLQNPASSSAGAAITRSVTVSNRGRSGRDRRTGEDL